jgi:hypothetical protein
LLLTRHLVVAWRLYLDALDDRNSELIASNCSGSRRRLWLLVSTTTATASRPGLQNKDKPR